MNVAESFFDRLKNKGIICWGVGKYFTSTLLPLLIKVQLDDKIIGLIDRDAEKQGVEVDVGNRKMLVCSPEQLISGLTSDMVIVISIGNFEELYLDICEEMAAKGVEIYTSEQIRAFQSDRELLAVYKGNLNYRKNKEMKIPKRIHSFWFSDDSIPEEYLQCIESWKKFCPEYEIKIWNLKDYYPENCKYFEEAIAHRKWQFASDYARVDAVYRYGGIYMDLDVELIRNIDDLLYNEAYMSFENLKIVECGSGFGAVQGNSILKEIKECYEENLFVKSDGSYDLTTCPVRYTNILLEHGLVQNGSFQEVEDITIYPFEVLTAKSFATGEVYVTDYTYSIHHHKGSWVSEEEIRRKLKRYDMIKKATQNIGSGKEVI